MGLFSRRKKTSPISSVSETKPGKTEYATTTTYPATEYPSQISENQGAIEYNEDTKLERGLKARHITMIAIVGSQH